jgi:hypothetical protein
MYRMLKSILGALSACAIVLCLSQVAMGAVPTRFVASYQIGNVVEGRSTVDLTLKLTLLNPTAADINGGIVVLYNTSPNRSLIGSFRMIKSLPHSGQVTISHAFTISTAEYARWQSGHPPVLEFLIPDGDGTDTVSIQARQTVNPGESTN